MERLSKRAIFHQPSVTIHYSYDVLGRRAAMTDTLGTTRYAYDDLGRMVNVSDPLTGTVEYDYDLAGNRLHTNKE